MSVLVATISYLGYVMGGGGGGAAGVPNFRKEDCCGVWGLVLQVVLLDTAGVPIPRC